MMNRKDDRSEGYCEHETGREKTTCWSHSTGSLSLTHIQIHLQTWNTRLHNFVHALVDEMVAYTRNHYSHRISTLSCAESVTEGHDTHSTKHTQPRGPSLNKHPPSC